MKSKLIHDGQQKTFVLVLDHGDEVIEVLTKFANEHKLRASHFTAIGALSKVTFAFYDLQKKEYQPIEINEQVEVMSLIGNVALKEDGERMIHAHTVVGKRDGTAHGGHVLKAHVDPTLEVFLIESPCDLQRQEDERSGLALISIDD